MADYLGAACFAVSVMPSRDRNRTRKQDQDAVDEHLKFARHLHIETRILEGDDLAETVVDFAHRNQITHIILSRRDYRWWSHLLRTDPIPVSYTHLDVYKRQAIQARTIKGTL